MSSIKHHEIRKASLRLVITIISLYAVSACDYSASSSSGASGAAVTASSASLAAQEVTLSGASGIAELAGDKVEIKDGVVFVNGVSFGPVPNGAIVKYTKTTEESLLFVGTERRTAKMNMRS